MPYATRQVVIGLGFIGVAAVAVLIAGEVLALTTLPLVVLALGWPIARFVLVPARKRFIAEKTRGMEPSRRPSVGLMVAAALGIFAAGALRQFGDAVPIVIGAEGLAAIGGGFLFMSREEKSHFRVSEQTGRQ